MLRRAAEKGVWSRLLVMILAFCMTVTCLSGFSFDVQAEEEDAAEAEDVLLEYVAVESAYVELGSTQTIAVSFENGDLIDSAVLYYHRESDGTVYEAAASDQEDGAFSFEISYTDEDQADVYVLDSLVYVVDGEAAELVLSEIGIDAQYGVETETETSPDAVVVDEEEDDEEEYDLEINIATFDEDGNLVSEDSIEEALEKAEEALEEESYSDSSTLTTASSNVVVVLDPGHDSTHTGASANGLTEHTLTLKIAQYCQAELEEYYGVTVYMTRTTNDCPYPGTTSSECNASRVEYAASVGADVYIAFHLNSATSSSASGVEIYYPNSNYNSAIGSAGSDLADAILEELVALGLTNRGTKIRNSEDNTTYDDVSLADYYGIIRRSKIAGFPAIIIEHAFLTNSSDAAFLKSESNLKALGVADATGIANYFGLSKDSGEDTTEEDTTEDETLDEDVEGAVLYKAHVQTYGWLSTVSDGATAGTTNQSKRLEALAIQLKDASYDGSVTYRVNIAGEGWQSWVSDGETAGTTGQSQTIQAVQIQLTGDMAEYYDIYYRVHVQTYGWLDWACNGETAGTTGLLKRAEAIEIVLVAKGEAAPGDTDTPSMTGTALYYTSHLQTYGWTSGSGSAFSTVTMGTTGLYKRMEAITLMLDSDLSGSITYRAHVQTYGWLDWVSDGELSGTTGLAKRLEAIEIELTGELAETYDIYYRVHVQTYGWLDWACNGETAGTTGLAKRAEAVQIVLVPKGDSAPGSTTTAYITE